MPQLIQAGKFYKGVPPLYSIPKGKKANEYFTRNIDFVRYIQKKFFTTNQIKHINGKDMTSKEATVFFMKNADYIYWVEKLATTYAVNPMLLEMALINHYNKKSFSYLKKEINKKYRFMDAHQEKGTTIIEGVIEEANVLFINDRTLKDCKPILDLIDKNEETLYIMNGTTVSIYEIMKGFEKTQPNHLQRYKGLGEMDDDQLAISTLLPTGDRTLIRYTIDDVKEEIGIIRQYETDLSRLFSKVGEVSRQDLLD